MLIYILIYIYINISIGHRPQPDRVWSLIRVPYCVLCGSVPRVSVL